MLPMLGLFCLTGLILYIVSWLFLRRADAAGLFAALSMLFVTNSGLVSSLLKHRIPWMRDRYILLVGAVLLIALFLLLYRKKKFPAKECCMILSILFATLTLLQTIPAVPTLWQLITFRTPELELSDSDFDGDRPNVYYFVLDEYGGGENLRRYYDFDNAEFLSFLEENHFNISDSSKNTESIWTSTLVPNLMNLGYHAKDALPERVKCRYLEDPLLTRLFRENGYSVNVISHKDFIGRKAGTLLHPRQSPDQIGEHILQNSSFSQFPHLNYRLKQWLGIPDPWGQYTATQEIFDSMMTCVDHIGSGPTLTISYVQSPHYPFLFDETGKPIYAFHDFLNKDIYLGQLRYLNQVLSSAISAILAEDPDSIIVLQSDHGTRYPGQMLLYYGEPDYDPYLETPYMQNALNCVYYRGRPLDIEGETGINTWRLLLKEAFGLELEPLTPPEGYIYYGRSWDEHPDRNKGWFHRPPPKKPHSDKPPRPH